MECTCAEVLGFPFLTKEANGGDELTQVRCKSLQQQPIQKHHFLQFRWKIKRGFHLSNRFMEAGGSSRNLHRAAFVRFTIMSLRLVEWNAMTSARVDIIPCSRNNIGLGL